MIAPARRAAYEVLREVEVRRSDLPDALASIRDVLEDDRDRALVTTLVHGALRWRNRLDWLIARAVSRDLRRLDPEVLDILRLGTFQLLFLSRVPASAVVDDSVSLTRRAGKSSASGLVNAVLRRISRTRSQLDLPPVPTDPGASRQAWIDALSVTGSHPRWLVERWVERLGPEAAAAWIEFDNEEPGITVRANTARLSRDALADALRASGVETAPLRFAPDGLAVTQGNALRTPEADRGLLVAQDEASQLVPLMAGPAPRRRVLDACAAPGGKTLILAAGVGRDGLVVAADRRARRLALLRQRLASAGATAVRVVAIDLIRGAPFLPGFDLVLLDAPCTGLGTLRREVDIRWRRTLDDVTSAAAAQARMIDEASRIVAPGGRLVYATCSSEPEENEQVVAEFLGRTPEFRSADRAGLVAAGIPDILLSAEGFLATRPDRHGLEMFFAAALDRQPGPAAGV